VLNQTVLFALRKQNFCSHLLNVPNLEGSLVAACVTDATGVTVVLDDAITHSVQAARSGICDLALQVGNTGQTQSDSHRLAHTANSRPHNCEMAGVLSGSTVKRAEAKHKHILCSASQYLACVSYTT
jgi:hypothetical protein